MHFNHKDQKMDEFKKRMLKVEEIDHVKGM